jgi:hypothetical protein
VNFTQVLLSCRHSQAARDGTLDPGAEVIAGAARRL